MLWTIEHPLKPEFTFAGFTFPRYIADIPPQGADRAAALRKRAESRKVCGPYYHAPKPILRGPHPGKGFYLEENGSGAAGLRWKWADEIADIQHEGWYSDDEGIGELIRGIVAALPHGRGFLAGWSMGEHMASSLDGEVYDDEVSAAWAADSIAECAAENEREYQRSEREHDDD